MGGTETAHDLDAVRAEVRTWLDQHWAPGTPAREWLPKVIDAGWAVPTWPEAWHGRGLGPEAALVVAEEFARAGAPGSRQDLHNLWANTLLAFGTEEAKAQYIRPLLQQELGMCLLYSEPGAGSDLAAVQTRADRDGDEWVVNGQKVWTSSAATADFGMLIARTDWDVPKHQGITFFWLPMKQPGIEVRPIKQITGEAHFNEVFITDARVPAANVVGPLHGGWRVLQTALAYERSVMGDTARGPRRNAAPGRDGASFDLADLARAVGRSHEPVLRQRIAQVHILREVNRLNAQRGKAQIEQGSPSPVMSLGKLAMSAILHESAAVQQAILGAEAMLAGDAFPRADDAGFLALNAYFTSIGGGTDQIQRNIIGERVLGLPKEPELDRDVAFKEVKKATVAGRG